MAVVLAVFLDLVGFGIVVPQLPLAAARFTSSGLVIGAVVATDSLLTFLLAPKWGRLSDRIGRRPVILLGLAGSAIAYTVFGMAGSLAVLFLARILSGSLGATVNVAQAALADTTPPEQRSRAMGLIGAAFGLAFTVGPALGGLASRLGEGAPGLLAASICLVNFLLASLLLRESRARRAQDWGATIRVPRAALVVTFAATLAFTTMYVIFQQFGIEVLGLTRAGISYAFTLVGLVSVLVQGRVVRRLAPKLGELRLVSWGGGLMAAGLALMPLLAAASLEGAARVAAIGLAVALLSAGFSLVGPCVAGFVSRSTPPNDQGRVLGTLQSIGSAARIVGPPVLGALADTGGFAAAFGLSALAGAAAGGVAARWKATSGR
ncbi:MAG: tetracycline resistance protein [Gemmatimonadetes bacterium]|nr:tetracycline resistance protein [Gemmatimonadota bacterium]